ncbi:NAD(P)/FAD-dependent oxidoreductase [Deinococcus metallilatus]|uniref:NAD(P)/FAD-dependent oxidoreductase n=1 Tax=Deinococcus metallilatus TaxID=1211322 RepID=A0AAJ5F1U2_9DEIO|nr:NAD(P)/FAD-dependent oxidoreductase [Deinococcus metallilatus]MBB5296528.1 phytoene dehydrogenase-like protein [Deinococcus metallilatus]QBY08444.1 NAD(P)/FAD-dependent oxidoreductase [Deinococcus metallilatus]RXJ11243.1 NAD(P)/FAD-dependent oxidoreductase [Deinococcus metallilatus]TLK24734.1 NAD(P)/FAD-dependent oxidoreductase [Deinococcus metallilatus]GMA17446.1 P49 secreted protein [Deinococcus metallilatus]
MPSSHPFDAVIVGAGPNGLAAAVTLARAGLKVRVLERHARVGGGLSSAGLTLPGFVHDVGSAIHPLGFASPAFRAWPLHAFGLTWVQPDAPFGHVLEDGTGVVVERDLRTAAQNFGEDAEAWLALFGLLVDDWRGLLDDVLKPLPRLPRHPLTLARFGVRGVPPATWTARLLKTPEARAVWAGLAAHSNLPLGTPSSGAAALLLGTLAHAAQWPFPRGGAQALADALAAHLCFLGGEIETGVEVRSMRDLPPARAVLVDSSPGVLLALLGDRATPSYRAWLRRYRYGPGLLKLDYALSGPVPWRDPSLRRAGTLHLGGSLENITHAEASVARGVAPERPYVLAAQPTLFDPSRSPAGQHILWAYAHTPPGTPDTYAEVIQAQIERAAPGFRDLVLARHLTNSRQLQAFSPVFQGGDVNGGRGDLWGLLARPVPSPTPYRTPVSGVYLCSSATPPGGGIHGMSGYWAARAALRDVFGKR